MMKRWKKTIGVAILTACLLVMNGDSIYAKKICTDLQSDTILETLANKADMVENVDSGWKYTFNDLNSTILASKEKGILKLICNQENLCNVVEIDQDNCVYLDGKLVTVTETINNGERSTSGWQYRATPIYGNASDYTIYHTTTSCRDIQLQQQLINISEAALMVVLVAYIPAAGVIGEIVVSVKSAYINSYTTHLSCKTRITYHKDSADGWKDSMYCEKHVITWYENKDFSGKTVQTTHYEARMMI